MGEPALKLRCRPESLPRRHENGESLIAAELNDVTVPLCHHATCHLGEARRQPRRRLVSMLHGELGVAPHIGNEEGADLRGIHEGGGSGAPDHPAVPTVAMVIESKPAYVDAQKSSTVANNEP